MEQPSNGCLSSTDIFEKMHVIPKSGRTLIVGSKVYDGRVDRRRAYANAEGWDMLAGDGVDRVINLEDSLPSDVGVFAHIECISVLEHSRKPWALAENIERLLDREGTLHLQVPFIWRVHSYPDDYWRFTTSAVQLLFSRVHFVELLYVGKELDSRLKAVMIKDHPYFPRTQIAGFGKLIGDL